MDAIGFVCVSLYSSTVQLQDSLGGRCICSEADFISPNGDHPRGVYYQRAEICYAFFGQKDSMQRIFINKFILFGGKCLSHKAFNSWVEKFSLECLKVIEDA
jgi:hypothetical protein